MVAVAPRAVAAAGLAAALLLGPSGPAWAPSAAAQACVHRGPGHWDRHGGPEDDRFHLAHGEAPTCHDPDDGHRHDEDVDEPHHDGDRRHDDGEHHDEGEHHEHDEHDGHHDGPHLPFHDHERRRHRL